ncbi:MAG: hypothetical protein QM811_22445 [Pirellulales bacterium]
MPFAGRIESLAGFPEQTAVKQGQLLTQVVPADLKLRWDAVEATKHRLEASLTENNNVAVELVTKQQSQEIVRSMESTVAAAQSRLESGKAKFDYASSNLRRISQLWQNKNKTDDELEQAKLQNVEGDVDYRQDKLVLASLEAMLSATRLMPIALDAYMDRKKGDSAEVLKRQLEEVKVQQAEVERDLERGKLLSPIDGVVLERLIVDEQYLAAGAVVALGRPQRIGSRSRRVEPRRRARRGRRSGRNRRAGRRPVADRGQGDARLSGRLHQGQLVGRRATARQSDRRFRARDVGQAAEGARAWASITACACGSRPTPSRRPWSCRDRRCSAASTDAGRRSSFAAAG